VADTGFILRFGVVGGLIGTLIHSPFVSHAPMLIHSIGMYIGIALVLGWVVIGFPTATISGVVFWWLSKRGMAVGHQSLSWWIACLASALPLILLKVIATANAGNLLVTFEHTLWTCLFFLICVVLTVRILELYAQRQYMRIALLGVLGLAWFMSPVIHRAHTFYPYYPG
jgi:hypothetical protein